MLCPLVGSYHTLSGQRCELLNPDLLLASGAAGVRVVGESECAGGGGGAREERQEAEGGGGAGDEEHLCVVRQCVKQVVARFAGDALLAGAGLWMDAVGWSAVGAATGGKDECKKQAKMLLKKQQGNLHVWAAFAAAEAARGCDAAARAVLQGAAQMASNPDTDRDGWPVICKVRLELELSLRRDLWEAPFAGTAASQRRGGAGDGVGSVGGRGGGGGSGGGGSSARNKARRAALAAVMAVVDPAVFSAGDDSAAGKADAVMFAPTAVIKARRGYNAMLQVLQMIPTDSKRALLRAKEP